MQTDSELESDTSSINDGMIGSANSFSSSLNNFILSQNGANSATNPPPLTSGVTTPKNGEIGKPTQTPGTSSADPAAAKQVMSYEQLENRIDSLLQENRVLKIEIETYKLRIKAHQEENKELRKASVNIQVSFVRSEWSAGFCLSKFGIL